MGTKMRIGLAKLLIAVAPLGLANSADAQAYKCKSADGSILISGQPCEPGAKTEAIQPRDHVSQEQKREAEQLAQRQRIRLADREAFRLAEQKHDQDTWRRLAEEESQRQTYCLQMAQGEPDPQSRADMIAACNGAAPPRSIFLPPAVYFPAGSHRHLPPPFSICVGNGCKVAGPPHPPDRPGQKAPGGRKTCRQAGLQWRCD